MGAAIVNDDGAINVIPFGAPAIKDVPILVTLPDITSDVNAEHE
jgi:hypothetical protein